MKVTPVLKTPDYLSFGDLSGGSAFKLESQVEPFDRRLFIKIDNKTVMMFIIGDDNSSCVITDICRFEDINFTKDTAVVRRKLVELTFCDY